MPAFPEEPDGVYANVSELDSNNFKRLSSYMRRLTKNRHVIGLDLSADEVWFALKCIELHFKIHYQSALKEIDGPTSFVGDIHGNYPDVMSTFDYNLFVNKEFSGGYYRHDVNLCFLGDYVDRGEESLRTILTLMLFAVARPKQVTLLRGNHEVKEINFKYGLKEELDAHFKTELPKATAIFELLNTIFGYFPILGKHEFGILMAHGGISKHLKSLDVIRQIALPIVNTRDNPLVHDLLWSDPCGIDSNSNRVDYWLDSQRGTSNYYNEGACKQILKGCGASLLIRAHEVVTYGIEVCFNGKLFSLFSCTKYKGELRMGAFVHIDIHQRVTLIQFIPANFKPKKNEDKKKEDDDKTLDLPSEEQQKKIVNPPKQEEKGKVSKLPKQKDQGKKAANRPKQEKPSRGSKKAATFGAVLIFCCVGYFYQSSEKETTTKREASHQSINGPMFATMSAKLSRVVNGISISQSKTSGSFDEQKLIDELFSLGPDATLSKLSTSKVTNIGKDLEAIQDVIGKECVGDGGCGLSTQLLNGVTAIQSSGNGVAEISKELLNANTNNIVDSIDKMKSGTAITDLTKEMKTMIDKIPDSMLYDAEFVSSAMIVQRNAKNMIEFLDQLSKFAKQPNTPTKTVDMTKRFDEYWKSAEAVKKDLMSEKERLQRLANVINDNSSNRIQTGVATFIGRKRLSDQTLTSGFPNGFDDIVAVLNDDKDEWLKKLLNPGKDIKELSLILTPLQDFKKKLEPLHSKWKSVEDQSESNTLKNFKRLLVDLPVVPRLQALASTFQGCMDKLTLEQKTSDGFRQSIEKLKTATTSMDAFKTSLPGTLNNLDSMLQSLREIDAAITKGAKTADGLPAEIRPIKDKINSTITLLNQFGTQVNSLKLDAVNGAMKPILAPEYKAAVVAYETWSNTNGQESMNCLKDAMDSRGKDEPAVKSLQTLVKGNREVDAVIKLSNALEASINEYKKIESTFKKSNRASRSVDLKLSHAEDISRHLGAISSAIQKLVQVKKASDDFQVLIDARKEIDSIVGGISDPNEKAKLQKLWNAKTVKSLENIQETANGVDGEIRNLTKIEMITDLKNPYFKAADIHGSTIEMGELAGSLEGKVTNQKLATSIKKLENLDLLFAKRDKKAIDHVLNELQEYFDSVFGVDRGKGAPWSLWDYWVYFLVGGGFLLILGAVAFVLGYFCWYKKKKNVPAKKVIKPKSSKEKKSQKSKVSKQQKGAGEEKNAKKEELVTEDAVYTKHGNGDLSKASSRKVNCAGSPRRETVIAGKNPPIKDETNKVAKNLNVDQKEVDQLDEKERKHIKLNEKFCNGPAKEENYREITEYVDFYFLLKNGSQPQPFIEDGKPGSEIKKLPNLNDNINRIEVHTGTEYENVIRRTPEVAEANKTAEEPSASVADIPSIAGSNESLLSLKTVPSDLRTCATGDGKDSFNSFERFFYNIYSKLDEIIDELKSRMSTGSISTISLAPTIDPEGPVSSTSYSFPDFFPSQSDLTHPLDSELERSPAVQQDANIQNDGEIHVPLDLEEIELKELVANYE